MDRSTAATIPSEEGGNSTLPSGSADDLARDINTMVWRVVPPVLLLFGTFGNVMTVVVMRGMRASPSTACLSVYFTALAMSDQCQLLSSQVYYWGDKGFSWPSSFFRFNLLCSVPKFMWCWGGIMSSWCLVAMTYQRVISVIAPHRVGALCTVRRGKVLVGVIVLVGFAINVHFLFTWVHWPEYSKCHFRSEYWHLLEYFEWQDLLTFSMLPSLLLVVGWCRPLKVLSGTMERGVQQGWSRPSQVLSGAMERGVQQG
ncbi:uncharacterized protein LOC143292330 [Babylonia areolata]|uniref:uncharacterized protein LOC143292330 n=1 Tax=Babylonia areolata TaxID=304850 RepID=UPI003FD014A8